MTIETTQISTDAVPLKIVSIIAKELGVGIHQVSAAVTLLDGGATVPFIAPRRLTSNSGNSAAAKADAE